jgi:hypothetical protein
MFRALQCPSSGACQTAVAASGFCMNVEVEVFSGVVGLSVTNRKIYCFVVQTLLNMFRALQCPSLGARQTAVAASGFRMNVILTNRPRLGTLPPPYSYRNQGLQRQFDGLLMMGIVMPETC